VTDQISETDFDSVDYFRSDTFVPDPFPYYEHLRAKCPMTKDSHHDVLMVTGWDEITKIQSDTESFSACNVITGPFPAMSMPEQIGDDITEWVAEHRTEIPFNDQLPSLDPPLHTIQRGLLMKLLTLRSLKESEERMWQLADNLIDEWIEDGQVEVMRGFAAPFAILVIADLLGVPDDDFNDFKAKLQGGGHGKDGHKEEHPGGRNTIGSTEGEIAMNPLQWLYGKFAGYITDRRENPKDDILTGLANAKFPDGSTPSVDDVCKIAANLFAAGQETTVRLISSGLRILAENPELQQQVRANPDVTDIFVEETLRFESPIKGDFRLAQKTVRINDTEIPAGTTVMTLYGAANRDPRQFENPTEFRLDRDNVRQHLAFGRGVHTCPGGPLARTEGRIATARLLQRLNNIALNEQKHGPAGNRTFSYAPTYILRGLNRLYITFDKPS
jgi:cytochrome P450